MIRHIDWTAYAETLLGPADWTDAASIAALYAKAQTLLPSELIVLPAARIARACLAANQQLHDAVAAARTGAQPLRVLLADPGPRGAVQTTLTRIGDGARGATLALGVPAPEDFARLAAHGAGLAMPPPDEDLADDAALYIADFLRAFAAAPIVVLRLGTTLFEGLDTPIVGVAAHYGWEILRDADVVVVTIAAETRPEDARALVAGLERAG